MSNDIHGGTISAYHVHCKYTRGFYYSYIRDSNIPSSTLQIHTMELQWKLGQSVQSAM